MQGEVRDLIHTLSHDDRLFESELASLAEQHGIGIYRELMLQLSGKQFDERTAFSYWEQARAHRDYLERTSGHRIGLRSALLNILHTHSGELTNPVFVESEQLESIRHASVTDGLTGLHDQTYFKRFLFRTLSQHRRSDDESCALVLFDVDRFKQYNDRCGHLAGDEALRTIADIICRQIRDHDVAARYGGEEFALFIPRADRIAAHAVANRIRRAVETAQFPGEQQLDSGNLTISGGVAVFPDDAYDAESFIEAADRQLYQAKIYRNTISPDRSDRRREMRQRVQSIVEYRLSGKDNFSCGLVYDISNRGIGIGCCRVPEREEVLTLRFDRPFWNDACQMQGRVRQIRPNHANDVVYLGVEFDEPLNGARLILPEAIGHRIDDVPFHSNTPA